MSCMPMGCGFRNLAIWYGHIGHVENWLGSFSGLSLNIEAGGLTSHPLLQFLGLTILSKGLFKWFRLCMGLFKRLCDYVETAEKGKSLSNGSQIKFEFQQTFAWLPFNYPFVLLKIKKKLGRVKTI